MSWSIGEARALSVKAARGAGFSWGVAEEVGSIVAWLQASGAPGVQALAQHLAWRDSNLTDLTNASAYFERAPDPQLLYCPITLGCALQDHGLASLTELGAAQVRQPLLLIPFIAKTSSQSLTVSWGERQMVTQIVTSANAMLCIAKPDNLLVEQARCNVSTGPVQNTKQLQTRVPNSDTRFIKILKDYAGKTYAPATEASRLAGAGAGLTDND